MTIGKFARLCRLSVKQLRHYDELGLLTPARVDGFTGYRYYTRAQAGDALTIALLRDADVPLPGIRAILDAPEPTAALAAERDRLAARIERDRERLAVLTRLASGATHDVELTDEPALTLAIVSGTTMVEDVGPTVGRLIGELLARTHAWRPPLWGLFPLDLADGMTVSVGVEAETGLALPATRAAVTVHHGPYGQLSLAYYAVLSWIHDNGLRPVGLARESYLVTPGEAAPEELITRVVVPVEG